MEAVELEGADLRVVDGVDGLAGAVLAPGHLLQLAPALAAHLGIIVSGSERD